MLKLNTVSALEMDEIQEEIHQQEIVAISQIIADLPNHPCAVLSKCQDPMNSHKPQEILSCNLYDFLTIAELYDCKNGIDLFFDDNHFLVMLVYGALYEWQGDYHYKTVALKFMPYDQNEQFIDIMGDVIGQ